MAKSNGCATETVQPYLMTYDILILNPVSGISGDRVLSCLAALGIDESFMNRVLSETGIGNEVRVRITTEKRRGIQGSRVTFGFTDPVMRTPDEMREKVRTSGLTDTVKSCALSVIDALIDAEAGVHGSDRRHVRFHELAHPDTIADAVIVSGALEHLGFVPAKSVEEALSMAMEVHGKSASIACVQNPPAFNRQ